MDHLQEAYLSVYEANKADEFVTSNMKPNDVIRAKQWRRQGRDFEGVLHPNDYTSQGEPVRQKEHLGRRGVRKEESEVAKRAKDAVKHQRAGTHGDAHATHAMGKELEASTAAVEKATKYKGPKVMPSLPESVDLYDVILSHLLDEGFADNEKNAITIMANMSEAWKEKIMKKKKHKNDD